MLSSRFHRLGRTALVARAFGSTSIAPNDNRSDVVIPGTRHEYGSFGDDSPSPHSTAVSWQAAHNSDIQQVTQKALIYELAAQQTKTIESVVPWFLNNMPQSYFRQIPEPFRLDHIKAIAAIKGEHHL